MQGLILTGHESGRGVLFDTHLGEEVLSNECDVVTDLQLSSDRPYFITSSKDQDAHRSQDILNRGAAQ